MTGDLLDAMLILSYHTGQWAHVGLVGTHSPVPVIQIGRHQFRIGHDDRRVIAWAMSMLDRTPNAPLPEPPN